MEQAKKTNQESQDLFNVGTYTPVDFTHTPVSSPVSSSEPVASYPDHTASADIAPTFNTYYQSDPVVPPFPESGDASLSELKQSQEQEKLKRYIDRNIESKEQEKRKKKNYINELNNTLPAITEKNYWMDLRNRLQKQKQPDI